METTFNHLLQTRKNIINVLKSVGDKAHIIPEGYSNSMFWNAAHCLVTQQLICYRLSGLDMSYSDEIINEFKKGSKASDQVISEEKMSWLIEELESSVVKMKADYEKGMFKSFKEYPTSYGVTLNSSEEAIRFNVVHEGLHLGYMMALRKAL